MGKHIAGRDWKQSKNNYRSQLIFLSNLSGCLQCPHLTSYEKPETPQKFSVVAVSCQYEAIFTKYNVVICGHVATDSYPYVVSLMTDTIFGRYHSCGGSIINRRTVITAAHCLASTSATVLKVHVGEKTRNVVDGLIFDVLNTHYHQQWTAETQDYDVGLVRIEGWFTYSPSVQPIKLASSKTKIKDGHYATVLGWGYTSDWGPPAEQLRMAQVPIVKQSTCNRQMGGLITKRMICAGFKNGGVDACQMDSGGPLVYQSNLIGIVSWGVGCAQRKKPGVYARVTELLPWIKQTLQNEYNELL
ncbi:trypsin-1-like [Musca vetustissima]|uniref:trypsin-1-like n=1 Tax=Musca vetustissima TaxID=27455 RepID=UPI002AB657AA|nr:trypsin-1-like [Musca vetustissima]